MLSDWPLKSVRPERKLVRGGKDCSSSHKIMRRNIGNYRYHRSEIKVMAEALRGRLEKISLRDGVERKPVTPHQITGITKRVEQFLFGYRKWKPQKPLVPFWRRMIDDSVRYGPL